MEQMLRPQAVPRKKARRTRAVRETLRLSQDMVDGYISWLAQEGCSRATINSYRSVLQNFYDRLPADKRVLHADSVAEWTRWMEERGRSEATIQTQRTMLNGFLRYVGKPEWQAQRGGVHPRLEGAEEHPALSREEYLVLLRTARDMGWERAYLLIKTMGGAGINSLEMANVTVEAVEAGRVRVTWFSQRRLIAIPEPLRGELLDYARRTGVESGPIFVTREGKPLLHSYIWREVQRVCAQTGIEEKKCGPKNLRRLCQITYRKVQAKDLTGADEAYRRLLEREEALVEYPKVEYPKNVPVLL